MSLIFFILLVFVIYAIVRNFRVLKSLYNLFRLQRAAQQEMQNNGHRYRNSSYDSSKDESTARDARPTRSSVERINDANLDPSDAEVVDYEEVK